MADYKVCQRCKERIDIEKERYHHEPRKYWHKKCWEEVLNEQVLGIEPQKVIKKERAIPVKKNSGSYDAIMSFSTEKLGMTKSMVESRVKKLVQDGVDSDMIWAGLRYYYNELGNEPEPYKFWPAERFADAGVKYYKELEEVLLYNSKQVQQKQQVIESANVVVKQSRWQSKIKAVELQ